MGATVLTTPLLTIFNQSINQGVFPGNWKEAIMTPVYKKGEKNLHDNYRTVSCLPAAAKLLEMMICEQVARRRHMENILNDKSVDSIPGIL